MVRVAEQISLAYEALPNLAMSIVTGSVARGIADASSDLDVYLFWKHIDVEALTSPARAEGVIGSRLLGLRTETGFFEKYRHGDRLVDVESVGLDTLSAVASSLDRHEPMSPLVAKTMAGLRDAVPLRGADELDAWRTRLVYTPEQAIVETAVNLRRFLAPVAIYELTLARGDIISFSRRMSTIALGAIGAVAALNRYALPAEDPKWLPWHVARMPLQPSDFMARLQAPFDRPHEPHLTAFASALLDTLDLVESEMPAARPEVRRARFTLAFPPDAHHA